MMRLMRKIVQIAATRSECTSEDMNSISWSEMLYALCDDGTLWERYVGGDDEKGWTKVEEIPQS